MSMGSSTATILYWATLLDSPERATDDVDRVTARERR